MGWAWLLALASVLAWTGCARRNPSSPAAESRPPLRIHEASNGVVALQVVVRDLLPRRRSDPVVRLVGVTHLGSAEYYQRLQSLLDREPLVLFEGVGARDKKFMSTRESSYSLQPALAKALGLKFQLSAIDYSHDRFVNSELSVQQLAAIARRQGPAGGQQGDGGPGEDLGVGDLMAVMDGSSWACLLVRFGVAFIETSPKLRATVRLVLIETLGAVESDPSQAKGLPPEMRRLMEVLIQERNAAVVADLRRLIDRGRASARARVPSVAVFYGAGHLPDLERRIQRELGYRPGREEWLTAFDVHPARDGMGPADVAVARGMVREQLRMLGMGKKRPKP